MKYYCLFALLICQINLFGQPQSIKPKRLLNPLDTLSIDVGEHGEFRLTHIVKAGETLYSIAPYYGSSVGRLYMFNPELGNGTVPLFYPLQIPIEKIQIMWNLPEQYPRWRQIPLRYTVKKGETLFRIAKKFEMPLDSLLSKNRLSNNAIEIGQHLLIGWMDLDGLKPVKIAYAYLSPELRTMNSKLKLKFEAGSKGKSKSVTNQTAIWDMNQPSTSLIALHKELPVGTIIKVINPLTHRHLYLKIIDALPLAKHQFKYDLMLNPAAAKALGAVDPILQLRVEVFR